MDNTFHIQWHITDNCHLRCKHCYQDNFSSKNDLPFEKLILIYSNICEFLEKNNKKLVIDITGGEPFLHKDWKKLVEKIIKSDYVEKIGIITNGLLLDDLIIYEIEKNKIILKISTEGVEKESYEFFRGKNYEKFIKICEKIKDIKTEKYLMFTLLEKNWNEIFNIFDFAKNYNFNGVIIERFIPYGLGKKLKEDVISFEKWVLITEFLHKICNIKFEISDIVEFKGYMVKIKKNCYELYGSQCIVGKYGIAIMPDGKVFPCRRFPLSIGNLLKDRLIDIWRNSEVLNKIRNKNFLKGICKNCIIDNCIGCRALAYSIYNDFLEEDPLCYLKFKIGGKNENN
ncbi:MAG: radical SAM protein [Candidatus Omnitrophica bacterium]|nr:radical SAM protein [Candidatus Omnitrophota bacterium]